MKKGKITFLLVVALVFSFNLTGCSHADDTDKSLLDFGEKARQIGYMQASIDLYQDLNLIPSDISLDEYSASVELYKDNPTLNNFNKMAQVTTDIFDDILEYVDGAL